ncbi:MAG TPA: hypothetical protein VHQ70_02340 [Syntrophomonadaceae bacterium]|nr:hypothetical protein [Syntrophomonadaceae bacterium]
MDYIRRTKESIKKNVGLWIVLWLLLLLNIMMIFILSRGISLWIIIFGVIMMLLGSGVLEYISALEEKTVEVIPDDIQEKVRGLMEDIKPLCEDIFSRELNNIIEPVLDNHRKDFSRGLTWLWENGDDFGSLVDKGITEVRGALQTMHNLSDDKFKMVNNLQENVDVLLNLISQVKERKGQDFIDLNGCLNDRAEQLKRAVQKEKEIFYDYIRKLLVEQIRQAGDEDITEYVNIYKLGDQFQGVLRQSVENRMGSFEDGLIEELESFSADIVGRMQKSTSKFMNTFGAMEEIFDRLMNDCRGESNLLLKRLGDARSKIVELKEKSGEIMVTLAWQDILIEKRWQDMEKKLLGIKDHVMENVGDDVVDYIINLLNEEIPGFSTVSPSSETAVIYKSLVDAEVVYQVYINKNLPEIITDGIYSLLLYVRPLELMISRGLRFSEEGNKLRRSIKDDVKTGLYKEAYEQIIEQTAKRKPALAEYLRGLYPQAFYTFCNDPYVKQKTENLSQAAWMLFMMITEGSAADEAIYQLIGLLLAIHKIRSKYIQPLKNVPLPLENEADLDLMRHACFKTVSLLLKLNVKGLVKLNYHF